jgi:hypothetical protein
MLGGVTGNICDTDYSGVMDSLGEITSGILTSFPLEHVPDPESLSVTVDIPGEGAHEPAQDAANGWTYNENPEAPMIEFHGTEIPPRGSEVTVEYIIAGEIQDATE